MTRWTSDRSTVRRWVLAAALVVLGSSCSEEEEQPRPAVQERPWDVIGVVTDAEHLPGYETTGGMTTPGGPGSPPFTVGPVDLVLADGTRLYVPAETPGGNACLPLMTEADRRFATGMSEDQIPDETVRLYGGLSEECVMIAALDEADAVEWFEILSTDPLGRATVGDLVERRGSGLLTESGFVFSLAPDADLTCGPEPVELASYFESDRWEEVAVDVASGDIVAIDCLFDM